MPAGKRSWWVASGGVTLAALLWWVGVEPWRAPSQPVSPPSSQSERVTTRQVERPSPTVSTLHEQATSAYHARLFVDEDALVLITQTGFTTLRAGSAPVEHVVSLGPVAARQGGSIVFWRSGKLRSVSLSGDDERELATVPRRPQFLLASEGQLAWLHADPQSGTTLQALSGGEVRSIHASQEGAATAVLHGTLVYWVSLSRDGAWAIQRAGLDGRPPKSTRARRGRPPSMLAVGRDGVYFYDGPQRGVRRLTFDLERETAVLAQGICSPLAVSSRVVCAHVGGLFEIPPAARMPQPLAAERSGPITATAATDERAYWVAESGPERLVVRSVALDAI